MFKGNMSSHLSLEVFFVVGTPGQLSKCKVAIIGNPRNVMIGNFNRLNSRAPRRNGNYLFTKVRKYRINAPFGCFEQVILFNKFESWSRRWNRSSFLRIMAGLL